MSDDLELSTNENDEIKEKRNQLRRLTDEEFYFIVQAARGGILLKLLFRILIGIAAGIGAFVAIYGYIHELKSLFLKG